MNAASATGRHGAVSFRHERRVRISAGLGSPFCLSFALQGSFIRGETSVMELNPFPGKPCAERCSPPRVDANHLPGSPVACPWSEAQPTHVRADVGLQPSIAGWTRWIVGTRLALGTSRCSERTFKGFCEAWSMSTSEPSCTEAPFPPCATEIGRAHV